MGRYVLARIGVAVPTLVLVSFCVFLMLRLVPGDPVRLMFGMTPPPESEMAVLRHELGLDRPLLTQYGTFLDRTLHGDLGVSYRSKEPVATMIAERLPRTLRLIGLSLVLSAVLGLSLGIAAALHAGRWPDLATSALAVAGVSIPQFWLGLMLILVFAVDLRWFPVAGSATLGHAVLPAVTLALGNAAVLARVTRSAMVEVLDQDFVRTAWAKGLPPARVVGLHVLKNVLIPFLTLAGLQLGDLLSGAFVVENVFGYAGIGQLGVYAMATRDFPVTQGVVLLAATGYVVVNLLVDVLYGLVDPRIRYDA